MQGVLAERLGAFVDVQFEVVSPWSLASSEGAAGVHSPVEAGSPGVSEAGADSHFVGVVAAGLGTPAGTGEEHQAEGACIHVDRPAGFGEEVEGQEQPSVQADIPEAVVARWAEGTAAVSAVVVGMQAFVAGHEWAFLVGE